MTVLKIIALTIFIVLTVWLVIDGIFIAKGLRYAMENKIKYEKTLGIETIILFIWALCLSCLIFL
jgi:NADH:ubiquinone oxidoreductase subunit 3 (subunit A)